MPSSRRVVATFTGARPVRGEDGSGVLLSFRPHSARLEVDQIEDLALLGPTLDIPVVAGLGKVLRILRAARLALRVDLVELLDQEEDVAALLERAVGTQVALALRPRSRVRFKAWTDAGVETVEDVTDVLEAPDAYLVMRRRGRFPVRVPRSAVVRQLTECERWYEVLDIERVSGGRRR